MRRFLLPLVFMACLVKGEKMWGQAPQVVRIQIDGCGNSGQEIESESFQFVNGGQALNLNSSLSISGFGSRSTWKAVPNVVQSLNNLLTGCNAIFVDPFSPPYNGVIPPGGVVLAFIDQNPIPSARRLPAAYCNGSIIFVIGGNGHNALPMFANKAECTTFCNRLIQITIGNFTFGFNYDPFRMTGINGDYILIDSNGQIVYPADTDGCWPELIACEKPKFITPKLSPLTCKSVGHELPEISDIYTGNASYFTQPGRQGTQYTIGTILFDSIVLYANDFNSCNPATTQIEQTYTVRINPGPQIDHSVGRTYNTCGYQILPKINGNNPSGNEKYWTATQGRGTSYKSGDTIRNNLVLYAYDKSSNGCEDEVRLDIVFSAGPSINNPKDTTIACGKTFALPPITGTNITGTRAYYTLPGKAGQQLLTGTIINTSGPYYAYDESGQCFDEDTFAVTFSIGALYAGNPDLSSCDSIVLPVIGGTRFNPDSTFYFTATRGSGIRYKAGNKIGQTTRLYIYDVSSACTAQDTVQVTRRLQPQLDMKTGFGGCNSFALDADAINPTARYYFKPGGIGPYLNAGDLISNDTILYKYIGDSTCYTEKMIDIRVEFTPILDNVRDTVVCGPYILPKIKGRYLTGNEYYSQAFRGMGKKYADDGSAVIDTTISLYAFDENSYSCRDEKQFTITILPKPQIDPITDVSVCNSYTLPTPTGQNIPSVAYFDQPDGKGVKYTAGQFITQSVRLYAFQPSSACPAQQSFQINIRPGPTFQNNADLNGCGSVGLPVISGTGYNQDSTFYFTLPGGLGIRYSEGDILTQTTKLFIQDLSNRCTQDTMDVSIQQTPVLSLIDNMFGCDSVRLPADPANPSMRYFLQSDRVGASYDPGDIIRTTSLLYRYVGMPGCDDQKPLEIMIRQAPHIAALRDTIVCGDLILPKIPGSNLSGTEHYHTMPGDVGTDYYADGRTFIDQSVTLYAWDGNLAGCWDEKPFNITILPKPTIDSITAVTRCESYILPAPTGTNLTNPLYYEQANGRGLSYRSGDTIKKTSQLFIYQSSGACPAEQPLSITIRDSITSTFTLSSTITCPDLPANLLHTGKKNAATKYIWNLTGSNPSSLPTLTDLPGQSILLDTGTYQITLTATAPGCEGGSKTQSLQVIPKLPPLSDLTCDQGPDKIVFNWGAVPQAMDYGIELLTGPTGVRSPYSMIFSNLTLGQQVGVKVTPLAPVPCANGAPASLICRTNACDPITVEIINFTDVIPACSGDSPYPLTVLVTGTTFGDTTLKRSWSGPGVSADGEFSPSIAGPGNHLIKYTLTKDSCTYSDTTILRVGQGSVIILNDKAVECAPPSQRQFNIRMQITTQNTPYTVHYSYSGGRSSTFQSGAANFTLSASFGLIGDSIAIDSIVDGLGCKMQIVSMAGTLTFKAVQYISVVDTSSTCDFGTHTYQYQVRIKNPNHNDPLVILTGGGTIQDTIYISPFIPFGTRHQATVSHRNGCDTLSWDMIDQCACTTIRDTLRLNACENDIITIRGKMYTVNRPSGSDTIPPGTLGQCDTIRWVTVTFTRDVLFLIRSSICDDDFITVGGTIFDKNNLTGVIRLPGASANGCDSVISVDLDLLGPAVRRVRDTICAGQTVVIDGLVFQASHLRDTVVYMHMAANGCDSVVYYDIRYEDIQSFIVLDFNGCAATSDKLVSIRTISGGSSPYRYILADSGTATTISQLPWNINNLPSDRFNVQIISATGCERTFQIAFPPRNLGGRLDLGPDRVIKLGDTVHIPINASFAISSFRWITQNYLTCFDCLDPVTQPLVTTVYVLEVSDANGCTARDTLRIYVDPDIEFYVPNLFNLNSAQEANLNFNIFPSPQVFNILRFTIYDRWGNNMMDLKNLPLTSTIPVWDGKFKGSDAPGAVYVYKLMYETVDGRIKTKYGDITLVR